MKDLWSENEQFRDGAPVLENGEWKDQETYTPAPENTLRRPKSVEVSSEEFVFDEPVVTEEYEEDQDEEENRAALSDASLRLEQGNLWKMIMNHELFKDVDADPRAVKIVQKQIRNFARESMEVMLGMRQTVPAHTNSEEQVRHASLFNGLEVDVLKKLASAATQGQTEQVEDEEPLPPQPKKKTLNSIGSSKPKPIIKAPSKPLKKTTEPLQRRKVTLDLPPEFEPDYEPLSKPIEKMTQAELEERNRQAAARQAGRKSAPPADRAPMPSYEQQEAMAAAQVSKALGGGGRGKPNLSASIMAAINSGVVKKVNG